MRAQVRHGSTGELSGEGEICTLDGQMTPNGFQARSRAGALSMSVGVPSGVPPAIEFSPCDFGSHATARGAHNCYKLLQNCYRADVREPARRSESNLQLAPVSTSG